MSTIKDTALGCYDGRIPRGQGAKAQEVVDCLVAREQEMFSAIVEKGVALGKSRDEIHAFLVEIGMHAPEAGLAAAEGGDYGVLAKAIDGLVGWARGQGYRG